MIYSSLKSAKANNYNYPEPIQKCLDFLSKEDTPTLAAGRYEIDGDKIFVLIQDQVTGSTEEKKAESHEKYVDIQCLFTGSEKQGYAWLTPGKIGSQAAGSDNIYYDSVENEQFVKLQPGDFTIYFTNDIHRPNVMDGQPCNIHKAVCKILESII